MKKIIYLLVFITSYGFAQKQITLTNCYQLVEKNHPIAKQYQLLDTQQQLENNIIAKSKLPVANWSAQSTYQSDVTFLPISTPNLGVQPPNKDQYKTTLTLNQLIFNDGLIKANNELNNSKFEVKKQQTSVNLYQLKLNINKLFFAILNLQEQEQILTAKIDLLKTKIEEVTAGIKYGNILPSSNDLLKAEILKVNGSLIALQSNKKYYLEALSLLIGQPISSSSTLVSKNIKAHFNNPISRPESELFKLEKEQITNQKKVLNKHIAPQLIGFATGGYGNPGLNMLDNNFKTFYIAGLKLKWNVFDWGKNKKQRASLDIQKDLINNQQSIFNLNTNIALKQQYEKINSLNQLIEQDQSIVNLREKVLKTVNSQLKNGIITTSNYLTEFTNLFESKTILKQHQIQLLQAKANYNIIKGI